MTVLFRCGHSTTLPATIQAAPRCSTCGETVVARVSGARPHFTGTATGPFCETKPLDPVAVNLKGQA